MTSVAPRAEEEPPGSSGAGVRSRRVALGAVALAVLVLVAALERGAYPTPDAYLYLGLSRSLAEHGSYTNFGLVGDPPQVMVPPLYSLLLVPVRLLSGGSVLAQNAVGPLLLCAGAWLLARRLRLLGWRALPLLAACALVIGNRHLQRYAWGTLTDVPFLGALGFSIWLVLRTERRTLAAWFGVGLLCAAALIGMRLAGVGAACGLVLALLFARRVRPAAALALGVVLVAVPWMLYVRAVSAQTPLTYARYAPVALGDPLNAVRRAGLALVKTGATAAPYLDRVIGGEAARVVAGLLGAGLLCGTLAYLVRRRPPAWRVLLSVLLGHLAVVCVVRNDFQDRLVYPLYVIAAFVAARWLAGARWRGRSLAPLLAVAVGLHLAASAAGAARSLSQQIELWGEPAVSRARVERGGARVERSTLVALHAAVEAGEGAPLAFCQADSVRAFYYGPLVLRCPIGWRPVGNAADLRRQLVADHGAGRVLVVAWPRGDLARAAAELAAQDDRLRLLAVPRQKHFVVFEWTVE